MTKGAVWIQTKGKSRRLRRAKATVSPEDRLSIYYSEQVLGSDPTPPTLINDSGDFSVWIKPSGVMSSGSRFGDHCAINRIIEKQFDRPTFLVHRLDRFVWGLMVLAHAKGSATELSRQFQHRETIKTYKARVHGLIKEPIIINTPLEGKSAITQVEPIEYGQDQTLVKVKIETGRKHQIRAHLASIAHCVVGDRQYGSSDEGGIQLASIELGFNSPASGEALSFVLPDEQHPRLSVSPVQS